MGPTACNLFTFDPVLQNCNLFVQTTPAIAVSVAIPTVSTNAADILVCGFIAPAGSVPPPGFTFTTQTAPACPADTFQSAMGCNFTNPITNSYSNSYGVQGSPYSSNSNYATGRYGISPPPQVQSSSSYSQGVAAYGGGGYNPPSAMSSKFATLGSISSVSSVSTCATICDVNTNCNFFFTDGQSCVLMAGTGLLPTSITSGGRCGQIQRAGQINLASLFGNLHG